MFGVSWFDYWIFLAIMYLIILSVQDFRKTKKKKAMVVDARWNYVMVGITISLFSHLKDINAWYVVGLIVSGIVLNVVLAKSKLFGRADVVAFNWIYLGFGIISYPLIIVFFLFLMIYAFVMKVLSKRIAKMSRYPFFPVIAGAFLTTVILMSIGGY